jgi:tetratricopeptide (TPR) repeat protein
MNDDRPGAGPVDMSGPRAALRLINAGRSDDAIGMLGRFLADHPDDVTALGLMSLAHLRGRRWAEALAMADAAIGLEPAYLPAWQRRSIALIELDRPAEAQASAAEYLRLAPDQWHAHYTVARVLRPVRGRRQEALRHAVRAVELAPDDADAHNLLGVIHRALEDRRSAETEYRAALAIDPTHALARSNLALLTLGRAGTEEVMAGLREAAASDPQQGAIHRNMALVAVLAMARRGTWLSLIGLMLAWFVLALTQGQPGELVPRLVLLGMFVACWVGAIGFWLRSLRPYLRSLVAPALGRLFRGSDARWGLAGIAGSSVCAMAALAWPGPGLVVVVLGYVVLLGGSAVSKRLAARHRQRAATDHA